MPFEPGHKKSKGRPKGVPNKKTLILAEQLERLGIDVPEEISKLLRSQTAVNRGGLSERDRINAYLELLQYLYPKRKAIEFTGDPLQIESKQEVVFATEWGGVREPKVKE